MLLDDQAFKPRMILRAAGPTSAPEPSSAPASEQAKTSRFLEPYRFNTDGRSSLLRTLEEEKLGDDSSRRLFVAALEYEIGAFRQLEEQAVALAAPPPRATERSGADGLEKMRKAAITLGDLLAQAPERTLDDLQKTLHETDSFCRIYDTRYVKSLRCEVQRVATACEMLGRRSRATTPSASMRNRRRWETPPSAGSSTR